MEPPASCFNNKRKKIISVEKSAIRSKLKSFDVLIEEIGILKVGSEGVSERISKLESGLINMH